MRLFNALLILKCIQIAKSSNILRAEQPLCNSKLGMMSGFIADSALSVSSYKSTAYSATSSRPNSLNGWCPIEPTTKIGKSWIKVKLKHIMEISSLEINVTSNENSFRPFEIILDYYRDHHNSSRETWRRYKFLDKDKKIHLSTGTNVIKLFPRIVARGLYIRQVPNGRCIRFELYGCEFKDNLVSYAYGNTPDIVDKTFDETSLISNGDIYTIGGLGVLTDGILGVDNYKLDSKHEWVGWRRDYVVKYDSQNYLTTKNLRTDGLLSVPSGQFISLYFIFEDIRNFSYLMIHSNNFFHEEIQLLRAAVVSFSDLDEHYFRNATIHYEQQDLEFDMARPVMITLNNKIGSQVRVDLYFQSRWLLISEVLFESKVVKMDDGNFTQLDGKYIPRSSLRFDNKQNTDQSRSEIPSALSSLIILFCCTIILLLSTIALLIIKSRKLKETIRFKTDYKKSLNGWINSNCSSDQHKQLYHANSVNDECDEASDKLSGQSPQSSAFTMMSFEKTRGHKLAEIKSNFGSSLYSSCKNCKCRWELSPIDTRFRQCGCYSSLKYPQRSTASIFNSQQYCRHHSNPTDKPVISSNALYSQFQDYQLEDDGRMYDHIDTKVIIRKEEQIGSSSDYELYNGSFLVQCSENVYEEDARCVIKVLKQNACAFSRLAFNRDAQIMENCSAHPNILKVMLSAVKEIPPHVVFEHNGTELPEFLQNNKNKLRLSNV
ncbi:hypothetical protein GJ496_001574 [Pomphorhynchus laevis]|nr:hypothetical protein GJ496_001574 [Pomphorhynchus laevis]